MTKLLKMIPATSQDWETAFEEFLFYKKAEGVSPRTFRGLLSILLRWL